MFVAPLAVATPKQGQTPSGPSAPLPIDTIHTITTKSYLLDPVLGDVRVDVDRVVSDGLVEGLHLGQLEPVSGRGVVLGDVVPLALVEV